MGDGLLTKLKDWVAQPFSSDMPASGWLLFIGLVLIAAWIWSRVINKITE